MRLGWLFVFLLGFGVSKAAIISSTAAGGDWNLGTSWVGGVAPIATDDVIIVSGSTINVSTSQTCVNLTLNGTAILNFNTNSRAVTVNGTMTMNGTSSVLGNHNTRVLALQGDFNVPAGANVIVSGVNIAQAGTGTFNCAGAFTPTDQTGVKVFGNLNMYDGSIIDATVTEGIVVAGNMSVLPGTPGQHSKIGRLRLTVLGTTTVTGYFEFASSAIGVKSFNNTITVAASGTWDNTIGEDPVVNCNIVNNGVWPQPTGGNGRYDVLIAGNYSYSGTRTITFTTLRIQTNATVTNKGSLQLTQTANNALAVNGGGIFNNGDGLTPASLIFTGYTDVVSLTGGGSVNFANALNTVYYSAPINGQNAYPTTYYKMICDGDNTVSVSGATVVSNNLTISGATTVDVTGGTDLTGTGSLVMTGTSLLRLSSTGTVPALTGASNSLAAGTTIEFYRAGAQTAASSASYPYQNVIISGNNGSAVNLNTVSSIAGDFTVSNNGTFDNTANTPPLITVGGALSYGSSATSVLNTSLTAASVSISSGGFTYSNQTITLSEDDAFWAVTGAPVIAAGGTAQVIFTAGTNQQIAGTTNPSFNTLVINNSNGVTVNVAQVSVFGTLALTSGRLITGTNTVVMTTAGTVTRTSGFVEGNLNKTFALGTSTQTFEVGTNTSYTPASITCTSVTTSGSLTVSSIEDDHPDIYSGLIEPNNTVNRYWSLTNVSIAFSAFSTGQIGGTFTWVNGDEDPSLDNTAIVKWYNNSSLSWTGSDQFDIVAEQNPAMTVATSISSNICTFAILNPTQLPAGQRVDFQVGEKIDPTYVYNRLTGANNWNNLATWIQQRTGVISLTNGSNTITGSSTLFQSELQVGNIIMLITSPGTTYTITAIDPTLQTLTVGPGVPAVTTTAGFGRQYIPGINAPTSDVDAVVIGNTNIGDATTTITLDIDAQILTLDVGSVTRVTSQNLTHQNSTMDLTVLANATVAQPGGAATNTWNINDATADVQGDVTIGSAFNNTVTRISRINITTGTLGAGALKFRTINSGGLQVQTVLAFTGAGTVNLHGALAFSANRGTLISAAGSTFNFDRSASSQSIAQPTLSTAAWVYANIHSNNTSAAGANFAFTSTATSVTGNVAVQTGLMTMGGVNMVGAAGSTFSVADGATFEMLSAAGGGTGGFPSGFGTISLGTTSTVKYNQTGNTNPWAVRTTNYGHLVIGQNGSTRNFELANATTNVFGDLTIGSGTSTPIMRATGTATLNVTGNLLINDNATLTATNITNLNAGGNWTNDGTFTSGTNTVTFNSPAANVLQTLGGLSATSFNNLTINTSAATDAVRLTNDITVAANLVLTQGGFELNGNTLNISNSATTAITRTSGFIKSETLTAPYGIIRWFISNTTGAHVYPFGVSSTQYIPFTLNVTVAGAVGVGTGYVPVSTYATQATNPSGEYPSGVNNLNGTTGGASVTDRYWNITLGSAEFAGSRPTSTLTFSALNTEKPATWTAIGEPPTNTNLLLTQRWNTAGYWDPAQTSPAQIYTNNSPAAGIFTLVVPSVTNYSTSWTITDSSAPLPIELLNFTAELRNGLVEVKWTTESELNNDFFTIQRTTSGETFEDIAESDGAGTTAQTHRYTAYDQQPLPGKWYYRLRQTDFNGNYSYSKLVSVEVPESYYRTVHPNPGNGEQVSVSVSPGDIGKDAELWISDQSGRDVYRSSRFVVSSRDIQVSLSTRLSSGLYVLSLVLENEVKRFKLVVR